MKEIKKIQIVYAEPAEYFPEEIRKIFTQNDGKVKEEENLIKIDPNIIGLREEDLYPSSIKSKINEGVTDKSIDGK